MRKPEKIVGWTAGIIGGVLMLVQVFWPLVLPPPNYAEDGEEIISNDP